MEDDRPESTRVRELQIVNQRTQHRGFTLEKMQPEKFLWVLVTDVDPLCLKTRLASGMPNDPQTPNYIGKS